MELLFGEAYCSVSVCGVLEDREEGSYLGDRGYPNALCRRGVYGHACGTVTMIEQDLGKEASSRVAHDDRRAIELAYDVLKVFDDRRDSQSLNRGGILVERFDLDLKAWVGRGEHAVTTALVALDPLLPASGVTHSPWISTMVCGVAGVGVFSAVISSS